MAHTFYALVPDCEHDGDLRDVTKGLRAIGCRVTFTDCAVDGMYETGEVTFTTDDDLATVRAKAAAHPVAMSYDNESIELGSICSIREHDASYYR